MESKKDRRDDTTKHEHKNSRISILTVIGLSFVVIGSAFLLKKYLKRPESWSSWTNKWLSRE